MFELLHLYRVNLICHATRPKDVIIFRSPQEYKHNWPRVDIHRSQNDELMNGHIRLIKPMMYNYFEKFGICCNHCGQLTRGKSYRHRCPDFAAENCKKCNRIALPDALIYSRTKNVYCDSKGATIVKTKQGSKKKSDNQRGKQIWIDPGPNKCTGCNMVITTSKFEIE